VGQVAYRLLRREQADVDDGSAVTVQGRIAASGGDQHLPVRTGRRPQAPQVCGVGQVVQDDQPAARRAGQPAQELASGPFRIVAGAGVELVAGLGVGGDDGVAAGGGDPDQGIDGAGVPAATGVRGRGSGSTNSNTWLAAVSTE
jgi:hypothetical protein